MKKSSLLYTLCASLFVFSAEADEWIRINQLGYLPSAKKIAVFMSEENTHLTQCELVDAFTNQTVHTFQTLRATGKIGSMQSTYRMDFSDFEGKGTFYLKAGKATSPRFPIHPQVYNGTADFLLKYMRQQRCGFNPFLKDSCHTHDAFIEYHPTKSGQKLDVRGGWHDAADYLQYTTTSANAIYQMLFAYQQNPEAFADHFEANGVPGKNGIPDIIDEVKWGLDWLDRMNPNPGELYNQIADDRDHLQVRCPNHDEVDYSYGAGLGRPVYFCSGEPQQRGKFMNATTGVASTAGKFASCFALGARVLKDFYPEFAKRIGAKADAAYQEGVKKPGVCQTASVRSPYIYEEDNWTDDMELGAMELYHATADKKYLAQAIEYGRREPITPWMGADSARHYQWYPFMNMGHYHLAKADADVRVNREFIRNLKSGIDRTFQKAKESPFLHGIPYIWCSNNLTTAMLTQCRLYREVSGDDSYLEMETALLDWLLGCNPWGTSMIVGLPLYGDYPIEPHSAYVSKGIGSTPGGLVDGPVYRNIFKNLLGINTDGIKGKPGQDYSRFQPDLMVYNDAWGDYSTNEPTMDGTACLTYYLSAMQKEGAEQARLSAADKNVYVKGGIVRTNPERKRISLVFTAADKADGADAILKTLGKHRIQGAFFFTGEFFELFPEVVKRIVKERHYLGTHGFGHLLYMPWENPDSLLVSREEMEDDLLKGYECLSKVGVKAADAPVFVPPYEYYNEKIAAWAKNWGVQVVNFTPGTYTNADYTTPDMKNYRSSKFIYEKVLEVEKRDGLNGHILLIHLGTSEKRTDKFYDGYLDKLIRTLQKRGYEFSPILEATGRK